MDDEKEPLQLEITGIIDKDSYYEVEIKDNSNSIEKVMCTSWNRRDFFYKGQTYNLDYFRNRSNNK